MPHRARVIGTTTDAITAAEPELGRQLPKSHRAWLLANNGTSLESVLVFPVLDPRDKRKTWDSIVRQVAIWRGYCLDVFDEAEGHLDHLLPFAEYGTGDYYCFDYSAPSVDGEWPVVRWSHETGETEFRSQSFAEFANRLKQGEFAND